MSERDVFKQFIPLIAKMIVEIQKMEPEQYQEFKKEWLAELARDRPKALPFTEKVLIVIDTYLKECQKN